MATTANGPIMSGSRRPNKIIDWLVARNRISGRGETDPSLLDRAMAATRAKAFADEDGVIVEFAAMRDGERTSLWVTARVTGDNVRIMRIERSVGVATTIDHMAESWRVDAGSLVEELRKQARAAAGS